ncbi:MAG: hypothetical protein ACRDWS_03225 [Acidimicrobiia bacterium]
MKAVEGIVDERESMADLTMEEVAKVGSLIGSVSTVCTPDRAEKSFSQDKVNDFLSG